MAKNKHDTPVDHGQHAVKKCSCAAHGPSECVCGAWDDTVRREDDRSKEAITSAHHAVCECGGNAPGKGCAACEMWHALYPPNTPDQRAANSGTLNPVVGKGEIQ